MMPSPPIDTAIDTRHFWPAPSRQRPRFAPVHQIGLRSHRQSPHTTMRSSSFAPTRSPLLRQKADRHKRSAPTSSSHTPWPNPHSACGTAAAPLPAISCLGAFRTPAARARGEARHCRRPKTCTGRDIAPPITAVMPAAEAVLRGLSRKIALRPVHPFAASACSAAASRDQSARFDLAD